MIKGGLMSEGFAVVLNPAKKKVNRKNKMKELGKMYRDMKANGSSIKWQQFLKGTLGGLKFNPPVLEDFGVAGASFSLNFMVTHAVEHKVRKNAFKKYLMSQNEVEIKERIRKYYQVQMASDIATGAGTTFLAYILAKKIGKEKSALAGGLAATLLKLYSRTLDYQKCKDYQQVHVIQKEANKWASSNNAYFGEEFTEIIESALQMEDYEEIKNPQIVSNDDEEPNNVNGIKDQNAIKYIR